MANKCNIMHGTVQGQKERCCDVTMTTKSCERLIRESATTRDIAMETRVTYDDKDDTV